ncbi:MAG: hypothetical protein AAGG68_27795 [Bacteroidota bacterium]
MKQFDMDKNNLPSDFSWSEMEDGIWEKVDRKKRKRWFLWLFFFAFFSSSAAWGIWMIAKQSATEVEEIIVANLVPIIEEEKCLEQETTLIDFEEKRNKTTNQTNLQPIDDQLIKNKITLSLPSKEIPPIIQEYSIRRTAPISKLKTEEVLLETLQTTIAAPKIAVAPTVPWKRIALYSGINSFESNIKNQVLSEVNRNNLETAQVGMQVDFRYEWSNRKENNYWGLGLNYTRLHSRFEYYTEREITITRDLYLSPWELLLPREYLEQIYRQVQIKAIEKRRVIHHNSQNLLDFSFYKGVQKQWNTIDIYAHLGGRLNLVHWTNGKIANTSNEVILLEEENYYKWNIGANLFVESGFRYPITSQLDFSANFGLQQSLNNWIRKEQLVQQRPRIYWLNFGLSYGFK